MILDPVKLPITWTISTGLTKPMLTYVFEPQYCEPNELCFIEYATSRVSIIVRENQLVTMV